MKNLLIYVLVLTSFVTFGQTQKDMEVINTINMVRTNPKGFIPYVEKYLSNTFITDETKKWGKDLINELKHTKPSQPLVFDTTMYNISYGWSEHLRGINKSYHNSFSKFKNYNEYGENLIGGKKSAELIVILLLIDEGHQNKGHRRNILYKKYKYISVSTNDFVCVQNFSY